MMCKHCEGKEPLPIKKNKDGNTVTSASIESNKLSFSCDDDYYDFELEISNCPMCGAILRKE